jgi:hypothetical protein
MLRRLLVVVLCGMVTGLVFAGLTAVTLAAFAPDALAIFASAPRYPKLGGGFFMAIDLLMGIWTIGLYAVVSARVRPRMGAALVAFAWWSMKILQSANWVALGFVPLHIVPVPLVTTMVCTHAATAVGVWLYNKVKLP